MKRITSDPWSVGLTSFTLALEDFGVGDLGTPLLIFLVAGTNFADVCFLL